MAIHNAAGGDSSIKVFWMQRQVNQLSRVNASHDMRREESLVGEQIGKIGSRVPLDFAR